MDCGEEQLARLRQRYRVHGSEEIWVMADAHLWHRSAWRKGTLVVFRTKLGFSEEGGLFTGEPLVEISFSETAASAPPAVRKIDDHPLHSNEVEPYQLLVPCARLSEVPDTAPDTVKGAALRGFDIDPINPKRVGRVLLFLWELQHGLLSEDHRLMWAAVRRDHEGYLVHRTDLNCVLSSVMFRSTHEMLAQQGSRAGPAAAAAAAAEGGDGGADARASVPVLLQDIGRAKERLEQRIEAVVRSDDAAAAALDAEACIAELEEEIEAKEAQIDSLEVVCGRFLGFVDECSEPSHLRTTAPPGNCAAAAAAHETPSQTAEVVITNRRLLYHTLSRSDFREAAEEASEDTAGNNDAGYGEDHLASAKFFFDSLGVPTPVETARGGAPLSSTNPSPFAQAGGGEEEEEEEEGASAAKEQPADRRRFRSLWYGDITAVYKLSEDGGAGAHKSAAAADDAGDVYGSPSQRAFSPAGTAGGAGSPGAGSVDGVHEIFDPFLRPTEWAMDSGGQRVGAPQVNPSALRVVVNTDEAGRPSRRAPTWRARTYVIRASDDVRRYHHGVIEAKWLTHCRRDVRHVNCGLAQVLGEAVRTAECRWAAKRADPQEGSSNFLARSAMLPKKRTHSYGAPTRARLARWATNRVIRRLSTQRKTTDQPSPFDGDRSLGPLLCTAPAGVTPLELDVLGRSQTTPGLDDVFVGSPTVLPPPASAELRPTNVEFEAVDSPTGAETPVLQLPPSRINSPSSAGPEQVNIVFTPPDNNMLDAQVSVVLSAGSSCSSEDGRSGFTGTGCTRPCAKSLLEARSYAAASDEGLPTEDDAASSHGDEEEEEEEIEDAANLELVGSCRATNVTVEFSLRMLSLWSTRRLLNHFQSIDASGDGFVGLEEFRAALAPLFRSEELPAAFFRVFDAGGNGMLSFDGFLAGMTMLLQGHADKASFLFLLFDSDSDGVLTALQFREVVALFLQLNGLHAGLIDTQCTDATMLAARLFHAIERADPDSLNLVEFREALLHNAVVRPAFKRLQQHSDTVGALSSLIFDSLLEDEVAAATPACPPFARRKAARKGSGLVADVLAYSSDVAESLRPHHLITFGHEDWHLLVDLLDGLREATRKCITPLGVPASGKQGEGTAADYAAHSEDINVFVKSGDAPACFVYQKIDSSHPDTRDATFRGISDSVGPVLFIDHAPQVFRRIRELGGITSSAFLESLGLSEILLNMLIGSSTVLHHYIASGTSHGEFFLATNDRRFVIKTVSDKQKKILKRMLPRYVAYLQDEPNTLLPKYYAMATVKRGNVKLNVVVMGRVLDPQREVRQLYDLKARFTSALPCRLPEGNRKGAIMADIDLRRSLELDIEWHEQLLDQVAEDLAFLRENQLSGYSVLIGTDSDMPFGADPGSLPVDPVARMRRVKDRLQEDHPTSLLAGLRRLKQSAACCCRGGGDSRGPDDDGNEPYGTENSADAGRTSPPADAAASEESAAAAAAAATTAATPEKGPKPFLSTFDTPLDASYRAGAPHAGLNRSGSSLSHLAPGVSGAQVNTPPCSRAVQFQDSGRDAAATLRLRASTPLGGAEPASRAHSAGVTTESVGRCSEAETLETPALQHSQQQPQQPLRRSFTAPGRSVHGLREMLVEADELKPSDGSIHRTTPLYRTRRRRSSVLRQVSKEHVLAVMANTYVGERFMTEGHEKRKQQRLQTRGHERSVFQRHHGGVPSSCGKESFFLGIMDVLHEAKTRSEADAYGKRFLAYLELVCERKHQPKLLNLAELPSDVQFVGALESDTKVRLSVDVPRKLLHVTNVPRKGSNKVRRICEPYSLTAQTFSVEKPIDKRRLCSVVLRGPALLTPSPGSGVPRLAFERKRAVVFRTAAEREEFCSVVSMLGRAKEAGVKSGQSTVGLKVFSGTWNVGERPPGRKEELNGWLGFGRECDVVSVAAQECDYKPRRPFESCEVDWFHAVYEVLNDKQVGDEKYVMVDGITMWQMRLVVFVKVKHANKVSDVVSFQEATGIAHVGGNKGGVAIGFKFMESPMLFVGCHLAAHQEYLRRRHSDMQDIITGVSAHIGTPDVQVTNEYPHIFIAGDLNYRIDTKEDSRKLYAPSSPHYQKITLQDRQSVYDAIVKEEWASLRANDQLRKAMAGQTGRAVLPHFLEAGPLTLDSGEGKGRLVECPCFPPTFKVFSKFHKAAREQRIDVVNDYQGFGQGGTTRVPSWCDRVLRNNLFSNRIERDVATLHYNSCRTVVTSDHKPVYAIMSLRAREQYLFEKRSGSSLPAKRGLAHHRRSSVVCTRATPVIQLYNLQGTNLMPADPNGKSDPYVVVLTNFCTANIATEVQPVTLNPQWRETVTILPEFGDLEYVRTEYIYFVLFDKDSIGSDDPLGQAVLCLEEFTGAKIAGSEFKIPVYVAGSLEGTLSGNIDLLELPQASLEGLKSGCSFKKPLCHQSTAQIGGALPQGRARRGSRVIRPPAPP